MVFVFPIHLRKFQYCRHLYVSTYLSTRVRHLSLVQIHTNNFYYNLKVGRQLRNNSEKRKTFMHEKLLSCRALRLKRPQIRIIFFFLYPYSPFITSFANWIKKKLDIFWKYLVVDKDCLNKLPN